LPTYVFGALALQLGDAVLLLLLLLFDLCASASGVSLSTTRRRATPRTLGVHARVGKLVAQVGQLFLQRCHVGASGCLVAVHRLGRLGLGATRSVVPISPFILLRDAG
jgi:hypothetical protein